MAKGYLLKYFFVFYIHNITLANVYSFYHFINSKLAFKIVRKRYRIIWVWMSTKKIKKNNNKEKIILQKFLIKKQTSKRWYFFQDKKIRKALLWYFPDAKLKANLNFRNELKWRLFTKLWLSLILNEKIRIITKAKSFAFN